MKLLFDTQAIVEDAVLLTSDSAFTGYSVKSLW
jgi:PIN domain nuclease of toxin-antitoxin system